MKINIDAPLSLPRGTVHIELIDDLHPLPHPLPYFTVKQVHETKIVEITPADKIEHWQKQADGLFFLFSKFAESGKKLPITAIKTADCLPVLIFGHKGIVHLHAGWRGTHRGIFLQNEIELIDPYFAWIGPAIHVCCYQVGNEFLEHFKEFPQSLVVRNQEIYFNLPLVAQSILQKKFPQLTVHQSSLCTFCGGSQQLHSFRREKNSFRNYHIFHP